MGAKTHQKSIRQRRQRRKKRLKQRRQERIRAGKRAAAAAS